MKARVVQFFQEVWLQAKILFQDGRDELKLYRLERDQTVIWAPSKGNWVRARLLFSGFQYDRIQFVDGKKAVGKRSPLSYRPRDPRERGADKPWVDARYSGNRGPCSSSRWCLHALGGPGMTFDEMNATLRAISGGREAFYDGPLGLPYKPEGG